MSTVADKRAAVAFRKVVYPKPPILAACRNCKNLRYDSDDRMSTKGELTIRAINRRCDLLGFPVTSGSVCDRHEFARSDRSDR